MPAVMQQLPLLDRAVAVWPGEALTYHIVSYCIILYYIISYNCIIVY